MSPRFISATSVGYFSQDSANSLGGGVVYIANLTAGTSRLVKSVATGLLAASAMDWSPDGASFTYVANGETYAPEWHFVSQGADRVLTTFPTVRPHGLSPDGADVYLSFSGNGKYVALAETWVAGSSNDQAGLQVRDASGRLLASVQNATMATWSSQNLYFWDMTAGLVRFWQPAHPNSGASGLPDNGSGQTVQPTAITSPTRLRSRGASITRVFTIS